MNYYEFKKDCLGFSDVATLIFVGPSANEKTYNLSNDMRIGEDGTYYAYICDDTAIIPNTYTEMLAFKSWLKVYDDEALTQKYSGSKIKVYQSRYEPELIIQILWED